MKNIRGRTILSAMITIVGFLLVVGAKEEICAMYGRNLIYVEAQREVDILRVQLEEAEKIKKEASQNYNKAYEIFSDKSVLLEEAKKSYIEKCKNLMSTSVSLEEAKKSYRETYDNLNSKSVQQEEAQRKMEEKNRKYLEAEIKVSILRYQLEEAQRKIEELGEEDSEFLTKEKCD